MDTHSSATVTGLTPYFGPWTFEQAAHLLRRTTFGPTYELIKFSVDQGLIYTLAKLFEETPQPAPPVNAYFTGDPWVDIGETWINAPYPPSNVNPFTSNRFRSLTSWTIGLVWQEDIHLTGLDLTR